MSRRTLLKNALTGAAGVVGASLVGCESGSGETSTLQHTTTVPGIAADGFTAAPSAPTPSPTSSPIPQWAPDSLRTLAAKLGFVIGTAAHYGYLWPGRQKAPFDPYVEIPKQFNGAMITGMHMANPWNYSLMPARATYDFKAYDYVVDLARRNEMEMHAEPLIWGTGGGAEHKFFPRWFLDDVKPGAEATQVLKDFIGTVLRHFKQDIRIWSIVNEPFQPFAPNDIWLEKVGENYPTIAFTAARDAHPDATLVLNGVDNFIDTRKPIDVPPEYLTLTRKLTSEGLLDGVGFELHLQGHRAPGKDDLKRAIAPFQALKDGNMKIYVTELDVNLQLVTGTRAERWERQAKIFSDVLEVCLEIGVSALYTFGNTDDLSWLTDALPPPWGGPLAEGTAFDMDGKPKPAFYAMQGVMQRELAKRGIS